MGGALITEDGVAIEGEVLDDVVAHGVLTHIFPCQKEESAIMHTLVTSNNRIHFIYW
jgi:hypothetical protein